MFLKTVAAFWLCLSLCASPIAAQEWQLQPAQLSLTGEDRGYSLPETPFSGLRQLDFGPLSVSRRGQVCVDLPGGANQCEIKLQGETLMLIDRQAKGRMNLRIRFGIRP